MRWRIMLLAATLLLAAGAYMLRTVKVRPQLKALPERASSAESIYATSSESHLASLIGVSLPAAEETDAASATPMNRFAELLASEGRYPPLPQEEISRWLLLNKTNAASLLAVAQLGHNSSLYLTALTNFPNDPRVLFSVAAANHAPEIRRELLDRFKSIAPDNAMANYLSAADHLKNGEPAEAIEDLVAGSQKRRFDDYVLEDMQHREDLLLQSGKSPAEAKLVATCGTLLPHLSEMRALARDVADLQKQYLATGDAVSAEFLAQLGLGMARHLESFDGGRLLINDLAGYAIERTVINSFDHEKVYDFLENRTVPQHIEEPRARRAAKLVIGNLGELSQLLTHEPEVISYYDRLKLYGESAAMSWLKSRHPE